MKIKNLLPGVGFFAILASPPNIHQITSSFSIIWNGLFGAKSSSARI